LKKKEDTKDTKTNPISSFVSRKEKERNFGYLSYDMISSIPYMIHSSLGFDFI